MTAAPPRWTRDELAANAERSAHLFREQRLAMSGDWSGHFAQAAQKFDQLLGTFKGFDAQSLPDAALAQLLRDGFGEALRYLAGPPISDDDLRVIAQVSSLSPSRLVRDVPALTRIREVLSRLVDPHRFPWLAQQREATAEERRAALLASAVLLAAQRIETTRRMYGKDGQEQSLKDYLRGRGMSEAKAHSINTIVNGPQALQFCGECKLGERKADVVARLHDTRLIAIECKVSNSATNSVKRLNNDAAVKAEYWTKQFGQAQVLPAAVLSGVFNVLNLEQAQQRGLALFWAHDLARLGTFIEATL
jgi:hypothetical protein